MKPLADGTLAHRVLPDGRILDILPLTYGRARICVGRGTAVYDDVW